MGNGVIEVTASYGDWSETKEVQIKVVELLQGTITINNSTPRIGDLLEATLNESNHTGTLSFIWKANNVQVGTDQSYQIKATDLGKEITVEVSSSIETAILLSEKTAQVKKATQPTPQAPTTITLVSNATYEYSKDKTNWQESNIFTNLTPATTYTFYQRMKETSTHESSDPSDGKQGITDAMPSSGSGTGGGGSTIGAPSSNVEIVMTPPSLEKKRMSMEGTVNLPANIQGGTSNRADITETISNMAVGIPKTILETIVKNKVEQTVVMAQNPNSKISMDLTAVQTIHSQVNSGVLITVTPVTEYNIPSMLENRPVLI